MLNDKIDFVMTWVDGSDLEWQKRRKEHSNIDINISQYRDWEILKYWFRAVEIYAPWVNNIYVVTEGHLPDFLNIKSDKIKVIKHSDYIPEEFLPAYSSHPIEMNLHRIKGLSDKFVYFNDDMYLNQPVKPCDFFKNQLPMDTALVVPIAPSFYGSISNVMLNNISLINSKFRKKISFRKDTFKWFNYKYGLFNILNLISLPWNKFTGMYQDHMPSSMLIDTYNKVWNDFPEQLKITCSNSVRNTLTDVNQWLLKDYQRAEGNFFPRRKSFGKYIMIRESKDIINVSKVLNEKKFKMICINDHCDDETFNLITDKLVELFEEKFPEKCSYEI